MKLILHLIVIITAISSQSFASKKFFELKCEADSGRNGTSTVDEFKLRVNERQAGVETERSEGYWFGNRESHNDYEDKLAYNFEQEGSRGAWNMTLGDDSYGARIYIPMIMAEIGEMGYVTVYYRGAYGGLWLRDYFCK